MRLSRFSLAFACASLLSAAAVSSARAQDAPASPATPAVVDLGFLDRYGGDSWEKPSGPIDNFMEALQNARHASSPYGQGYLAPGQTFKFRTAFEVFFTSSGPVSYSSVSSTAEPPKITWTRTAVPVTTQAGENKMGWEYSVTIPPDAALGSVYRLGMKDSIGYWGPLEFPILVTQSLAPPRETLGQFVGDFFKWVASPVTKLVDAVARAVRGTADSAKSDDARSSEDQKALVGADGQPLPDDVADAIRARGAESSPSPGLAGVLRDRVTDGGHPERGGE
jgi:hypothetical protein